MTTIQCIWEAKAQLGEGVRYDPRTHAVWWVDILGQKIFCLDLATGKKKQWSAPQTVGYTFPCKNGDVLALLRHTISRLDQQTGQFTPLITFPDEPASNRFNDGVVGPDGRLWVGSMDFDCERPSGKLYCVDRDLQITIADEGYIVVNGPTFSPDGKKLYVNETMKGEVFVFDFNKATGEISNKKLFVKLEEGQGLPDGICVDTQGGLWLAVVTAGIVRRYLPDGTIDVEIEIPCPTVTSVGFGGKDNQTLFVTTGTILMDDETLAKHPKSGSLFSVDVSFQGLTGDVFSGG